VPSLFSDVLHAKLDFVNCTFYPLNIFSTGWIEPLTMKLQVSKHVHSIRASDIHIIPCNAIHVKHFENCIIMWVKMINFNIRNFGHTRTVLTLRKFGNFRSLSKWWNGRLKSYIWNRHETIVAFRTTREGPGLRFSLSTGRLWARLLCYQQQMA